MEGSEPYNWETDSPVSVPCRKCRRAGAAVTPAYKLGPTGTVDQLYVCPHCKWGTVIRFARERPRYWIAVSLISHGKSALGYVLPKAKPKGGRR